MNRQPRPHFHKLDWTYREAMEKKKCAPKNCDGNVFLRLPDAALSMIAECMFPVEVYQLILSSNSFLTTTTSDNKFTSSFLLRSSMTSSLDRILKCQKAGFTVSDFKKLCTQIKSLGMPDGSIFLAGSTMVQALMGRPFDEADIDLYVTEDAAPAVRTWLTSTKGGPNLVFNSIGLTNYDAGEWGIATGKRNPLCQYLNYNETKFSTVEKYAKMPTNQPIFLRRSYTRAIWAEVVEVTEVEMKALLPIVIEPLRGTKIRTFRKFIKEVDSQTPSYKRDSDWDEWTKEEGPVHAADVVIYM